MQTRLTKGVRKRPEDMQHSFCMQIGYLIHAIP